MTSRWRLLGPLLLLLPVGVLVSAATGGQSATNRPALTGPAADPLVRVADEVTREVEQLRGWSFKHPVRKERVSLARARQDVRRALLTENSPDRRARIQAFLRVAGLIPPDGDLLQTSLTVLDQQVAGYYDPSSRTLRLVERATPMPEFVERMVLAHELTHALDDQHINLTELMRAGAGTEDTRFVVTSLSEGSATSLMLQQMLAAQRSGRFSVADLSQYVVQELEEARTLEQLPRYFSAMFGTYVLGAAFLANGDLASLLAMPDNRTIGRNLLLTRKWPPRSSEQILHAEKYWDPAQRDEPVVIDDRGMDRWLARPGRRILHRDTLGELFTAILTEPRDAPRDLARLQSAAGWTNAGATGWGGDRFYLLAGESAANMTRTTKGLQGVWVTAWDTPKDRDEFLAALERGAAPPNSTTAPVGRQLAIVFVGFDQKERELLLRRLPLSPLTMTKGSGPWKDGTGR